MVIEPNHISHFFIFVKCRFVGFVKAYRSRNELINNKPLLLENYGTSLVFSIIFNAVLIINSIC